MKSKIKQSNESIKDFSYGTLVSNADDTIVAMVVRDIERESETTFAAVILYKPQRNDYYYGYTPIVTLGKNVFTRFDGTLTLSN